MVLDLNLGSLASIITFYNHQKSHDQISRQCVYEYTKGQWEFAQKSSSSGNHRHYGQVHAEVGPD